MVTKAEQEFITIYLAHSASELDDIESSRINPSLKERPKAGSHLNWSSLYRAQSLPESIVYIKILEFWKLK